MIVRKHLPEVTARREHGSDPATRGFFEITSTTLTSDLNSLTRQHGADFVVIGMLVPTREGLALCDTLRKQGVSDSTVLMLRNLGSQSASSAPKTEDEPEVEETILAGEISIVPGRHEAKVNGLAVGLTRTELQLLATMARRPGWVFSREKFIRSMHGEKYGCTERTIDVHITSLRRKLGPAAHHVETIRGVGYRFSM